MERTPLLYELEHVATCQLPRTTDSLYKGTRAGSGGSAIGPIRVLLHPSAAGRARLECSVASALRQRREKLSVLHVRIDDRDGEWRLLPEASQHRDRCAASSRQHLQVSCRRKPK